MRYLLGVDIGSTVLKACVFDENGKLCSSAARGTPVVFCKDRQERDMDELKRAVFSVIRRCVDAFGGNSENIVCVGCTGHGKGLYPIGKDKKIICNAIASTDRRAEKLAECFRKSEDYIRSRTLSFQPVAACAPSLLLRWLKENDPETYNNIGFCMSAKDYIRFVLTEKVYCEETDASGGGLVNLSTRRFDRDLFRIYGIEDKFSCFKGLIKCTDIAGSVTATAAGETGLAEGTPVCGGMFDIDACALSCGEITDSDICVVTGTWSINQFPSDLPKTGCDSTRVSLYCDGKRYLIEESSATSAGNLEWCINKLFDGISYREINTILSEYRAGDCETVFVPFLYGSICGDKQGAFLNLRIDTTRRDMVRAMAEGVAFAHRFHIERLLLADKARTTIKIAGGAVKSSEWMHIFADVLGMTVFPVAVEESGCFGAAAAASVAAGIYDDVEKAAKEMSRMGKPIFPDMSEHEKYLKKYGYFKEYMGVQ